MISKEEKHPTILIAEDDPDDQLLSRDALIEVGWTGNVSFVENGMELLEYLKKEGPFAVPGAAPRPALILLDLRMPCKDGWEAFGEIKADPNLSKLCVAILTTSSNEDDARRARAMGAVAFYTKPATYQRLLEIMKKVSDLCS